MLLAPSYAQSLIIQRKKNNFPLFLGNYICQLHITVSYWLGPEV